MTTPKNPFEGLPRHHMMFLNLRDGGETPARRGATVAEFYGVTLDELKEGFGEQWNSKRT